MNECRNCRVRIEDGSDRCPLCGLPVAGNGDEGVADRPGALLRPETELTSEARRTVRNAKIWLFEMVSLIAFTTGVIVFAADIASGFTLSWSILPLLAIGSVYAATVAVIVLLRRPALLLVAQTAIIAGFLLALNFTVGEQNWFLDLGLPMTLLTAALIGASVLAMKRLGLNVLQKIATGILAAGLEVVGIEFLVNRARGELLVSWSLIAFACTLSAFFLILFINKQLRERHGEFRKIFHL